MKLTLTEKDGKIYFTNRNGILSSNSKDFIEYLISIEKIENIEIEEILYRGLYAPYELKIKNTLFNTHYTIKGDGEGYGNFKYERNLPNEKDMCILYLRELKEIIIEIVKNLQVKTYEIEI